MNRTALTDIAPDIFRKRLLIEGYFTTDITDKTVEEFFAHITGGLGLKTYGPPIVHHTSGAGRDVNQGYDGFVPLIDSGIYVGVWVNPRFVSTVIYTCGEFDEDKAIELMKEFFQMTEFQSAIF